MGISRETATDRRAGVGLPFGTVDDRQSGNFPLRGLYDSLLLPVLRTSF